MTIDDEDNQPTWAIWPQVVLGLGGIGMAAAGGINVVRGARASHEHRRVQGPLARERGQFR